MRFPLITRRAHEQAITSLLTVMRRDHVHLGLRVAHTYLADCRAKAEELRDQHYANAPETWKVGWDSGQEWINQAITKLENEIEGGS